MEFPGLGRFLHGSKLGFELWWKCPGRNRMPGSVSKAMQMPERTYSFVETGTKWHFCRQLYQFKVHYLEKQFWFLDLFLIKFAFRFTNTDMLELLPDETEVLIFNGNNINYLRNNVIGMTQEHELLKVIDLSNNNITEISGKAFHKVRNVEKLILNHNDLR